MKIGILTGGGDSSAINAAIRAIVKKGIANGHTMIAIRNGWAGMMKCDYFELNEDYIRGILPLGGTTIGTSRTNVYKIENGPETVLATAATIGLDALIAIGGDDTLGVANKLTFNDPPLKCVGIPQTIDNDIKGTDFSIGYDTALAVATDCIEKIQTTARSHNRTIVVEVMGRDAGHIALNAGIAAGANVILVPEEKFHTDDICKIVKNRLADGKTSSIVVVAEGAVPDGEEGQITQDTKTDSFGHVRLGGIGEFLANRIEDLTGIETRSMNLGHLQRGGNSTPTDRLLATRFGLHAIDLVEAGNFAQMTVVKGDVVTNVPLTEAAAGTRLIDMELLKETRYFI